MDAMASTRSAQRSQRVGDGLWLEPFHTVQSGERQIEIGHRLFGHRPELDRRRMQVDQRQVHSSRDLTQPASSRDQRLERTSTDEPRLDVVDVPIPAVLGLAEIRRDDGVHDGVAFIDTDEGGHLDEVAGMEMGHQLDTGVR